MVHIIADLVFCIAEFFPDHIKICHFYRSGFIYLSQLLSHIANLPQENVFAWITWTRIRSLLISRMNKIYNGMFAFHGLLI